jgi:hypothetical protein
MFTDHTSAKTGGITSVAGHYMSACCRSDVFLKEGETKPRCLTCGQATEWCITLCRSFDSSPLRRKNARQQERHAAPEDFPRLSRVEWSSFGMDNIRVLNYSSTGIAVEVADPAIFFGAVNLTLSNGAIVSGMIRHCKPKGDVYVLGIACEMDLRTLGLEPSDAKPH